MHCSRSYLLYQKTVINLLYSGFHNESLMLARFANRRGVRGEPGIDQLKEVFKDVDPELVGNLRDVEDLEDVESLETDFMDVDRSYHDIQREKFLQRKKTAYAITAKKFFPSAKEPHSLTYSERKQIKQLHESDPNEWTPQKLSESFPATVKGIKKVLKTNFMYENEDKIKSHDNKVLQNWKLLAEGKLEAEPDFISHLKKFVHRQESVKAEIESGDYSKYLPPKKIEPNWNDGKMKDILLSYEKQIEKLDKQSNMQLEGNKKEVKKLANKKEVKKFVNKKSAKETVEDRIQYDRQLNKENKDFVLGGSISNAGRHMTLSELQEEIRQESLRNENLPAYEQVILDESMVKHQRSYASETDNKADSSRSSITSRLRNISEKSGTSWKGKVDQIDVSYTRNASNNQRDAFRYSRNSSREEAEDYSENSDYEIDDESGRETARALKRREPYVPVQNTPEELLKHNTRTAILSDLNKMLDLTNSQTPILKEIIERKKETPSLLHEPPGLYEFKDELEAAEFQKEENDLKGTIFWDKKPSPPVINPEDDFLNLDIVKYKDPEPGQVLRVYATYDYPLKIKIPKSKRKRGLTYQVKDCFYDDRGEFLYRVPGMIHE